MVPNPLKIIFLLLFCAITTVSCSEQSLTDSGDGGALLLVSATPIAASRGSAVTLVGSGFSIIPQENIVLVGGIATAATAYGTSTDGQTITFQVPASASLGDQNIFVIIESNFDTVSNQITLTVTP